MFGLCPAPDVGLRPVRACYSERSAGQGRRGGLVDGPWTARSGVWADVVPASPRHPATVLGRNTITSLGAGGVGLRAAGVTTWRSGRRPSRGRVLRRRSLRSTAGQEPPGRATSGPPPLLCSRCPPPTRALRPLSPRRLSARAPTMPGAKHPPVGAYEPLHPDGARPYDQAWWGGPRQGVGATRAEEGARAESQRGAEADAAGTTPRTTRAGQRGGAARSPEGGGGPKEGDEAARDAPPRPPTATRTNCKVRAGGGGRPGVPPPREGGREWERAHAWDHRYVGDSPWPWPSYKSGAAFVRSRLGSGATAGVSLGRFGQCS